MLSTKIFIGFRIRSPIDPPSSLKKITYGGKEFIGCYLEDSSLSTLKLQEKIYSITKELQKHSEKVLYDPHAISIFPQSFFG